MSDLQLLLLGPPRLERAGAPLALETRKALALLVYLAVSGQPHGRETLATLFWPEYDQHQARTYLRRAFWMLNKSLGPGYLTIEREIARLNPKADLWLDVAHFRHLLAACEQHGHPAREVCAECLGLLAEAVDIYRDDFLAGFSLPDSPAFDEWQFFQAEALRQALANALERLIRGYTGQNQYEQAISTTRRWMALNPLHEPAQRALMKLYAQTGQQAAALRQYQECSRILAEEMGLKPEEETMALFEAIKMKQIPVLPIEAGEQESKGAGERQHPPAPLHLRPPATAGEASTTQANLPLSPTPFVGREKELAEIEQLLLAEPGCRLLTLVGPGGIGKTRLALEAAARLEGRFPHGVFFVPLASVGDTGFIVMAIAEALRITFHRETDPLAQLLSYLRQKKLLLILDNFEHLLSVPQPSAKGEIEWGLNLLSDILSTASQVTLLVTSRERLGLQEEWSYPVRGMRFPTEASLLVEKEAQPDIWQESSRTPYTSNDEDLSAVGRRPSAVVFSEGIEAYSAIRLFIQCARRAEANFSLSLEDIPAIARICQWVDGMPLGLELAAPWVRSMTCMEIAAEIERNLDFLTTSLRNVPERHRSLRAVFEQTWQRLPEAEQRVLSRLSIFSGGCSREAAEQVTGATLPLLSALVEKALLRRSRGGRYEMHDLIRQFGLEQLQAQPGAYQQAKERHCAYYTTFLQERTGYLKGGQQKKAVEEIAADIDNIRAAWQHAAVSKDIRALEKAAECLWLFYDMRETFYEAEALFQQAVTALIHPNTEIVFQEETAGAEKPENLIGFLLAAQGYIYAQRGRLEEGQALMEQGVSRLRQTKYPDKRKTAFALAHLGLVLLLQGNYAEAGQFGEESLALFSQTADRWGAAQCYHLLGGAAQEQGQLAQAEQLLQKSLAVCRETGERRLQGFGLQNLGIIALAHGDYVRAEQYLAEATQISREFNDLFGLADTLLELGSQLAMAQGDYAQAIQYIEESLAIAGEIGVSWEEEINLYLGAVLRLQGRNAAAEQLYQETLAASRAAGHQSFMALCLSGLGCLAYDRQEYQQAEQLQQEALAIWQQIGHESEMASVLRHLGDITAATGDIGQIEAGQYFRQALQLAIKHGLAPVALDVFIGVALLLAQQNEMQQAVELLYLAGQHPARTRETKEKTSRALAELITGLSPDQVTAAQAQSQKFDWQAVTNELMSNVLGNSKRR